MSHDSISIDGDRGDKVKKPINNDFSVALNSGLGDAPIRSQSQIADPREFSKFAKVSSKLDRRGSRANDGQNVDYFDVLPEKEVDPYSQSLVQPEINEVQKVRAGTTSAWSTFLRPRKN